MSQKKTLRCRWVDELKAMLYEEWPDFKPIPERVKAIKEEMQRGDCIYPVKVVCDYMTGRCRIEDGRHRIVVAKELGKKQILVEETWVEPR